MQQTVQAQFGIWLKQQRKSLRLTQEDLAERLVYSSILVKKIEAGERTPSVQLVSLIADWLNIPSDDRLSFMSFARGQLDAQEAEAKFGYAFPAPSPGPGKLRPSSLLFAQGRLFAPLTPLIGRAELLQTVENLLLSKEVRLLTLTGPPGIGKTSLASEAARRLMGRFRDGVFFVSLASMVDPELVVAAITHTLGITDKSTESLLGNLQQSLSNKQMLLVLDNFEQVLDASPAVLELLGACPDLKVLTTSREALYVNGEQQFPVPSLATPDPAHLPPIETLPTYPAVALFMERARAVKPDFALTEENGGAVAAICVRLDGLPLAIELAAGHIRLLSPQEMQVRLDNRLPLPTGGSRGVPTRQQTLRAAIDWSYNLLNEREQTLFARLGVFVGGFTLSAAEAVCNAQGDLATSPGQAPPFEVQEGIEALLDKNLLRQKESSDGGSRYWMLETIREYALRSLGASGEEEAMRRRHAAFFLESAEYSDTDRRKAREELALSKEKGRRTEGPWLEQVKIEYDNLRAAITWAIEGREGEIAGRLAVALCPFWQARGYLSEGTRWLTTVLGLGGRVPMGLRAYVLRYAGVFARNLAELERAQALLEESLILRREVGGRRELAETLADLGNLMTIRNDSAGARACHEEELAIYTELGDRRGVGYSTAHLGNAAAQCGDDVHATKLYEQALDIARSTGNMDFVAYTLNALGDLARKQGDYRQARSLFEQGLEAARETERTYLRALLHLNIGLNELARGDESEATAHFKETLVLSREIENKFLIAAALCGLSQIAAIEGRLERAARLFGVGEVRALSASSPWDLLGYWPRLASARDILGAAEFARLSAQGQAMNLEQATAYGLQEC